MGDADRQLRPACHFDWCTLRHEHHRDLANCNSSGKVPSGCDRVAGHMYQPSHDQLRGATEGGDASELLATDLGSQIFPATPALSHREWELIDFR